MAEFKVDLINADIDIQNGSLIGIGDLHHGNQTDNEILLERKMIDHIVKHPEFKVLINGDIIDNAQLSNLPTDKQSSTESELKFTSEMLSPIYSQVVAIDWGNHEERTFREPHGKGIGHNIYYGHFSLAQDIMEKSSELVYAPLLRGIHINLKTQNNDYKILMKHGSRAGNVGHFGEFDDCKKLYNSLDLIFMNHTHRAFISPDATIDPDGKLRKIWFARGGAFTSWLPYQEKRNMSPSIPSFIEIPIESGIMKQPIIRMVI